jgi:hypothetical protein
MASTVDRILPGDVITIRYPDGAVASGHVAIVRSAPTARASTDPIVSKTRQFDVQVVDSSRDPHGSLDTRVNPDGTWVMGAGFGVMRIYTDNALRIVGHTWSTTSGSDFRNQSSYPMAVGRLRY